MIDLSIVPLYRCNLNCRHCYLGKLRSKDDLLNIEAVQKVLDENDVRVLDIYGGEITLLDDKYVSELVELAERYFKDEQIYITSNALSIMKSKWLEYITNGKIYPSFSYDACRPRREDIKNAISAFDKLGCKYSIICIDISDLDYAFLESLENMQSFSVKPFSQSVYMDEYACDANMEKIYKNLTEMPQLFNKLEKITKFRDLIPHYFLLPNGQLHDIQYKDGKEYFCELENCSTKISPNCLCCKYYKCCFNEHYAGYVVPKNAECLGRKHTMELLDGF